MIVNMMDRRIFLSLSLLKSVLANPRYDYDSKFISFSEIMEQM